MRGDGEEKALDTMYHKFDVSYFMSKLSIRYSTLWVESVHSIEVAPVLSPCPTTLFCAHLAFRVVREVG